MSFVFLLETNQGKILLENNSSNIALEPSQRPLIYNPKGLISVQNFNSVIKAK